MVNYAASPLDKTFGALSDPTRRAIITRLAQGTATVTELAEPFDISLPAVSKHLKVLERAGLLARKKEGRIYHCSLNPSPLSEAAAWIQVYERFWEGQFDALAKFIENSADEE